MDAAEIRQLMDDEIAEEVERTRDELARLRYRRSYEDLDNPVLLRILRRRVARLRTIQRERASEERTDE